MMQQERIGAIIALVNYANDEGVLDAVIRRLSPLDRQRLYEVFRLTMMTTFVAGQTGIPVAMQGLGDITAQHGTNARGSQ
jgi:hypothetical protein